MRHFTAAKAEYLTKNLKNEQNLANTCPTKQLPGTPHFGDKHETLWNTLKELVYEVFNTQIQRGYKKQVVLKSIKEASHTEYPIINYVL